MVIRLPELPEWRGHFVYVDRKADGSLFYVGVGNRRRVFVKVRNELHTRICNKYQGCYREIVFTGTRNQALTEERRLIAIHGRINNGTGVLANFTNGGDGGTGRVVTEEMRKRSSEQMTSKYSSDKWREFWKKSTTTLFTDEGVRQRHRIGVIAAWGKEGAKEKHRALTKAAMAIPEVKMRQSKAIREVFSTDEYKKKRSITTKKVFSDPAVRARQVAALKKTMNDPDFRKGLTERAKIHQNRPDVIEKKSNGTREMHHLRKLFIEVTGYSGTYSSLSLQTVLDYQAQALALDDKASTQTALRAAVKEYRQSRKL